MNTNNSKLISDKVIQLEKDLFKSEVRRSATRLDRLIADNFKEITSSGRIFYKDEALSRLPTEEPPEIVADKFEADIIQPDCVLITYRSILLRKENNPLYSLRSSIWQLNSVGWQMRFHQGTICPEFEIN